jgi:RHS repeat-associated protein
VLIADLKSDPDVADFFRRLPDADYLPGWYAQRQSGARGPEAKAAAEKTAIHAGTPTVAHSDSLGRAFLTIAHNRYKTSDMAPASPPVEEFHATRVLLDIEGNQRAVIDALDRAVMRYDYGVAGPEKDKEAANRIHQASMEAGERWMLNDVTGKPIRAWDSRGHAFRSVYDPLRRPIESWMRQGAGTELMVTRGVYGEGQPNPEAANLRRKTFQACDQAGLVTTDEYDFKGNLLRGQRQLAVEYKTTLDWSPTAAAVSLEPPVYTNRTRYDALNRPKEMTAPDGSVIRPGYNEANLLERLDVNVRGAAASTPFVANIDYDAKGQRVLIACGNTATTEYAYDPETFRLAHLKTARSGFAPAETVVQDLSYTHDPMGNITHIRDDAQQTIFFRNQRVEPSAEYTYDAVHRLIEAFGREHLGQTGNTPNAPAAPDAFDTLHAGLLHPGDGNAMGTYVERYLYDFVGNILAMQHRGSGPLQPGWTRNYAYNEASLIEPAKTSNRLSSTTVGSSATATYGHDAHGNITAMPHLPLMQWDFHDQLQATARQAVGSGTPETTWYVYDASGQRVRKVTERQAAAGDTPTRMKERIYLAGFEVYREYASDGRTVGLERETLHVMDDKQRVALVETRTQGTDGSSAQLVRYQFSNHLGSASLELDDQTQIVSYEEYFPYGSTSYQAVRNGTETPKRYRYTGKERDEESGSYYYGARYYAPWLGRWLSADPIGIGDGTNVYAYVRNRPTGSIDVHGTQTEGVTGPDTNQSFNDNYSAGDPKAYPNFNVHRSPVFTFVYGNTPGNYEHPPFLGQLYGSQKVHHYNTPYQGPDKFSPEEPDGFLQVLIRKTLHIQYSILVMKQKFETFDTKPKLEGITTAEFGLAYQTKPFIKKRWLSVSANFSATAGIEVADAKYADGSGMTVYKPWATIKGYSFVGFGATAVARVDATVLKSFTIFAAVNVHHYQGTNVKTSIGKQRVDNVGSVEGTVGVGLTIGPKEPKPFERRHYHLFRKNPLRNIHWFRKDHQRYSKITQH